MAASTPKPPPGPLLLALNWASLLGWSVVLIRLLTGLLLVRSYGELPPPDSAPASAPAPAGSPPPTVDNVISDVRPLVLALEALCWLEVLRILLGHLPGNPSLGVVLHSVRTIALSGVLPRLPPGHWTGPAVLLSWSVTEVARYPMYVFPSSAACRTARMAVPLATFPVGAFSEAYGALVVFGYEDTPPSLGAALAVMMFVNAVLGPTMAYPALLRKGLPALGLAPARGGGEEVKGASSSGEERKKTE